MTQPTDHRHIRTTIARFLDGETSVAEEKELYDFFRLPDIPADLKQYQPMFNWYASLGESHDEAASADIAGTENRASASRVRLLELRPWQWMSIAAMLALLLSVGFIFHSPSIPEEYLAYEGSYIIRDGKKITDLRIVVPEIERTQQLVNESLGEIDMSLRTADSAFDDAVLADEDLSDPMVKDLILSTLEY